MSEQDKENIISLASHVLTMRNIINSSKSPIGGKRYALERQIAKAANLCESVLASLGIRELRDDSPMHCTKCAWQGTWSEAKDTSSQECPLCSGEIRMVLDQVPA